MAKSTSREIITFKSVDDLKSFLKRGGQCRLKEYDKNRTETNLHGICTYSNNKFYYNLEIKEHISEGIFSRFTSNWVVHKQPLKRINLHLRKL